MAEVRTRADVRDAARVRHFVASTKRTVGYSIAIETTVYAAGSGRVLREYETVCVATGGACIMVNKSIENGFRKNQ